MVTGVGTGGDTEVETGGAQRAAHGGQLAPGPAVAGDILPRKAVHGATNGTSFDLRGEAAQQRCGMGLGQQRHGGMPGRRAEKGHGQGKIAKAPELVTSRRAGRGHGMVLPSAPS